MTAPSKGKALSVDFFPHSVATFHHKHSTSITWLHLLETGARDPFKLISHFSSIVFTASISRFPRTSKHISNIYYTDFPWCGTNMSVEGVKKAKLNKFSCPLNSLVRIRAQSWWHFRFKQDKYAHYVNMPNCSPKCILNTKMKSHYSLQRRDLKKK